VGIGDEEQEAKRSRIGGCLGGTGQWVRSQSAGELSSPLFIMTKEGICFDPAMATFA
jgi:hypothetical protein